MAYRVLIVETRSIKQSRVFVMCTKILRHVHILGLLKCIYALTTV